MDNLDKKFEIVMKVSLSKKEKDEIRGHLVSYIKTHPEVRAADFERPIYSRLLTFSAFPFTRAMPAFLALVVVIVSGAGASYAAEGSLPGDLLYPIKISINESIRGALARSEEEEVNWLVSVAERRLEETEKLASENRLDEKSRAKIEANFSKNSKKLEEKLSGLGNDELKLAADVTSRLETSLLAHQEVLVRLEAKSESKSEISSVIKNVQSVSESVKERRRNFEEDIFASRANRLELAVAARLKTSLESIESAKEALLEAGDSIDPEVLAKASAMIKEAEDIVLLAEAQQEYESTSTEDAATTMSLKIATTTAADTEVLTKLHEAVKLSKQAKIMLEAQTRLQLKVLEFESRRDAEDETEEEDEDENKVEIDIEIEDIKPL